MKIKQIELSERTHTSYKSIANKFIRWLKLRGLEHEYIINLERETALNYHDYLLFENDIRGKTINENIGALRSLINTMIDKEIISFNIFSKIKKQKVVITRRNIAYNKSQVNILRE